MVLLIVKVTFDNLIVAGKQGLGSLAQGVPVGWRLWLALWLCNGVCLIRISWKMSEEEEVGKDGRLKLWLGTEFGIRHPLVQIPACDICQPSDLCSLPFSPM